MSADAVTIYQTWLDEYSDQFWSRNWAAVAESWIYPHRVLVPGMIQDVSTPDELIDNSEMAHTALRQLGATALHRVCTLAEFHRYDRTLIKGAHRVYALNGGSYAHPPYETQITLRRRDGRWLGAHISSEVRMGALGPLDPRRAVRLS
jgi:hypothetical protein